MGKAKLSRMIILLGTFFLAAACTGEYPQPETAAGSEAGTDPAPPDTTAAALPEATAVPPTPAPSATPPPPTTSAVGESGAVGQSGAIDQSGVETEPVPPRNAKLAFPAGDGLLLQTTFMAPPGNAPFPGVLLLHMLGSNREVWESNGFAAELVANGYAVISVDMRGHGETGGVPDWDLAKVDLQTVWAAFAAMPEVDETRTAVVGASIGANMSLITGANIPAIQTVVLLSPGLDYRGVTPEPRLVDWGERPLLLVASEEDGYAADSARELHAAAMGQAQLEMYEGAGHGTNMFGPQPGLAVLIINWLQQHL